jgi:hypothetical protein
MRVAIRQCLRVGANAGALLEDFGVVPDEVHLPTRADVMQGDRMLLQRAAVHLKEQQVRSIAVDTVGPAQSDQRRILIRTRNLRRLDFFVDERPQGSRDLRVGATGDATLEGVSVRIGSTLRLVGYSSADDERPAAVHRTAIAF